MAYRHLIPILVAVAAAVPAICGPAAAGGIDNLLVAPPATAPQANPLAPQVASAPSQLGAPGQYAPPPGYGQPQYAPPAGQPQYVPAAAPAQSQAAADQAARDQAFQRALRDAVPLDPGQILQYRRESDRARKATVAPLSPAMPQTRTVSLTLKPGEPTPYVHVRPGTVSTLTFSDLTGAPWPVLSVVTGNPTAYVAQSAGEEGKTNIINVSPVQEHIGSNMVVVLVGYPVPVSLILDPDSPQVDYRLDIKVMARGPNAAQDVIGISNLAPTNDLTMVKFLDGTPPEGAREMKTSSPDVEAWKFEDQMYLRTRGVILSPSYTGRSTNVSGVNVFAMADSPVVIVSTDGRLSHVRVMR